MNYDYLSPQRITFGWGRRSEIGKLASSLGKRALLVSGSRTLRGNGTLAAINGLLSAEGIQSIELATIHREPEVEDVDRATRHLRL